MTDEIQPEEQREPSTDRLGDPDAADAEAVGDDPHPDFSAFKETKTWTFELHDITFEGREPTGEDADQQVAEIVKATGDASLLYYTALNYLHVGPRISPSEWQEFTASSRARIASEHLDRFGLQDFIQPSDFEELRDEMEDAADE